MPRHDWVGLAALVLAICLGVGWGAAIIISATPWTAEITKEAATLLNGIGQVLAGALAAFLGARITTPTDHTTDTPATRQRGAQTPETTATDRRRAVGE